MKKLLLAIIKESFENPTVTGCYLTIKPDSEPPYTPPPFDSAEHVAFRKPLGDVSTEVVLDELKKLGYDVEQTTFSL